MIGITPVIFFCAMTILPKTMREETAIRKCKLKML